MKNRLLIFILFLAAGLLLDFHNSNAFSYSVTISQDELPNLVSPEMARRTYARELLKFGFELDYYNPTNSLYTNVSRNSGYIYQVYIKHTKRTLVIDAYVFLKGDYKWSWRVADKQGIEKLLSILRFCKGRITGGQVENTQIYEWFD